MIKYICDKCGQELKDNLYKIERIDKGELNDYTVIASAIYADCGSKIFCLVCIDKFIHD